MPIPSIFINSPLPVIPGMKTLDDFIITNWFSDMPTNNGTRIGGFYFGTPVSNITMNSFNNAVPGVIHGSLSNSQGYVSVNVDNYLDLGFVAPAATKILGVIRRPPVPADGNDYFIADLAGSGTTAVGFAVGVGTDGRLRAAAQNAGSGLATSSIAFPDAVAVGDFCAFAVHAIGNEVYVAIYDPETQNYSGIVNTLPGTRVAGNTNVLLGRKTDNNTSNASVDVKSLVIINGAITGAQQLAIMQYLLAME
ncbi:hypothetical protein MMK78_006176 [Raoultella planticola]|uniref:hypothetical protein n=1 Tax=Raoultella planticola TaxID=575 RepID=UPI0010ED8DB6|nr:hypothetical protein [Raoultella planticola]EIY2679243.1 hypothetical protein [Raoultella planticola]VTM99728.1 Uncharacterised protein [Raoultella planticola]